MTNILQILPKLNSGGVERGTIEIATAITKAGFKSYVISAGGKMVAQLAATKTEHILLDVASKNPFKIWLNAFKIRKIIQNKKIDLVHARSRVPAISAYLACKNTSAKFITTFHGVYSGKSALKKKYNSIMLKGEKIITVSNFIKNHIQTNYNFTDMNRVKTIYRGVDLNEFNLKKVSKTKIATYIKTYQLPLDKKIILLPARLTEWKGQLFFLEALTKVTNKNYHALIVGNIDIHSNYKNKLDNFVKENQLEQQVSFLPAVSDLVNLYHLADIVISASLRPEAFGRTIIEAGAMGKIVIATNHGGAQETIINGKTGFLLAELTNSELAQKIDYILNLNATQKNNIATNAKTYVRKNFSVAKMQKETINLYKKILNL
ncbi:MAG: glycosyltransferase family 4 protein [Rickettsiales bacterium]